MNVAIFSSKPYDKVFFQEANKTYGHSLMFFDPPLTADTATLAMGFEAVCVFVNDHLDQKTLESLSTLGVKLIALRCAGYNNIDLPTAAKHNITVARVPAYSPHGVAEHAVALILALNRRICRANTRVHDGNFALDGLLGFELNGKTVGVMGTGKIGQIFAGIMRGFGCNVLAFDARINPAVQALGCTYVSKEELFAKSDIISLHLPLLPETKHTINEASLKLMKNDVMIINTSRGGLIQSACLIEGLKSKKIGYLGLDVYEEEDGMFFEDLSGQLLYDDIFARLLTFPNVLITGHQAFFTQNALINIANTTLLNIHNFRQGGLDSANIVSAP